VELVVFLQFLKQFSNTFVCRDVRLLLQVILQEETFALLIKTVKQYRIDLFSAWQSSSSVKLGPSAVMLATTTIDGDQR
jgi:hypothetical protein